MELLDVCAVIKEYLNMLELLHNINKLTTKHDETRCPELVTYEAIILSYTLSKGPETTLTTHLDLIWTRLEITE